MAYVQESDVTSYLSEQELAQLTDDSGDGIDVVDSAIVSDVLSKAESIVDSYLGKQYNVPLSSPPESVKDATLVITKYKLFMRRSAPDQVMIDDYENTIEWLEKIAEGKLEIIDDTISSIVDDSAVGFATDDDDKDTMTFDNQIFQ